MDSLREALKCFKHRVGQGVDCFTPRWFLQLPDEGLEQLAALLQQIEA